MTRFRAGAGVSRKAGRGVDQVSEEGGVGHLEMVSGAPAM